MSSQSTLPLEGWADAAANAAPLFKWAGGKQRFLWEHLERIPVFEGRYIEPFAGGLSVLFAVARRSNRPLNAVASDVNLRLVKCYQEVKRDWVSVADGLKQLYAAYSAASDKSKFYYLLRAEYNKLGPSAGAARFIFLMAAGWNGVYRVNQQGNFNVPHGVIRDTLALPSDETLASVAYVFKSTDLRATSWESTVAVARPGDFVFLDPPYFAGGRSQLYGRASVSFGLAEHARLANTLVELSERSVAFLLTNSAHPEIVKLYVDRGLVVQRISTHRSISSKTNERGANDELIVTPRDMRPTRHAEAELALRVRLRNGRTGVNPRT